MPTLVPPCIETSLHRSGYGFWLVVTCGNLLQPIRSTSLIWIVMHASSVWNFCRLSINVILRVASHGIMKCQLFSENNFNGIHLSYAFLPSSSLWSPYDPSNPIPKDKQHPIYILQNSTWLCFVIIINYVEGIVWKYSSLQWDYFIWILF